MHVSPAGAFALPLAFVLGLRHALEPDHLAAVAAFVGRAPTSRRAAWLGAGWGAGHAVALVGAALLVVSAGALLPSAVERTGELAVAALLIALGVRNLWLASRAPATAPYIHSHGGPPHEHPAPDPHVHVGPWVFARRAFGVGLVHGLAGSGSLTALALAGDTEPAHAVAFVATVGAGALCAMALLAALAGTAAARLVASPRANALLTATSGALACAVGLAWGLSAI